MRRGLPALLLTTLARAAAAEVETEFAPFLHDSDRPQVLALDGPIDGRTPVMFQRALQRFADVTVLELSSDGGNVYDALPLAYVVRRVGLRASIPPGRSCASACTYLFFAGVGRDAEGQLGVHSIAMPSNDLAAGQLALADIFAAFEDFGVPSAVHTRMMATPAESMYWFAPEEMVALGLIGQIGAVRSDAGLRASLRAQLELETAMPDWAGPPPGITPGQLAAVEQQRQLVAAAPEDAAARDVLAGYEAALGNYRVAHQHKSYVIALRGADAGVEDFATLVYYLVAAAAGQVSSEAEVALRQALQRDETNGISLYYLGLMYGQNGRPGVAFAIWRDLMARSQPTDPWVAPIQSQIETVAAAAGIDTDQPAARVALPPGVQQIVAPPPPGARPGATVGTAPAGPVGPGGTGGGGGATAPAAPSAPAVPAGDPGAGSYPEPSGLAIFAAALVGQNFSGGAWSGRVTHPAAAGATSMRLSLSGDFLKVAYPELGCGGYWELEDNGQDNVVFIERLTYGQDRCADGGRTTILFGGGSTMQVGIAGGSATLQAN